MFRASCALLLTLALILPGCSENTCDPTCAPLRPARSVTVDALGQGDFATIADAIAAAADGDTILLASGVYQGVGNTQLDLGKLNLAIMSVAGEPDSCVLDGAGDGTRALRIVGGQDERTVVSGIKFRNFYFRDGYFAYGAAMMLGRVSPVFRDCVFEGNAADYGGAVALVHSAARFEHCIFRGNRGFLRWGEINSWGGGAVYSEGSHCLFAECEFAGNKVTGGDRNSRVGGGAVYLSVDESIFRGCIFRCNSSELKGGAVTGSDSEPRFVGCLFAANSCADAGGAFSSFGDRGFAMVHCDFDSNSAGRGGGVAAFAGGTIAACRFRDNLATYGGGLVMSGSIAIDDCEFQRNTARNGGAAEAQSGTDIAFGDCIFQGNEARDKGGAVHVTGDGYAVLERCTLWGNHSGLAGGSLAVDYAGLMVRSCTIGGGGAPDGAALYARFTEPGDVVVSNTIVVGTMGGESVYSTADAVSVICSDIWGNAGGDYAGGIAGAVDQDGNISADPMFCSGGDLDLFLDPASPCTGDGVSCGTMGAWPVGCTGAEAVSASTVSDGKDPGISIED